MRLRLHPLAALVMLPHLFLGAQPRPSRPGARGTFEVTEASLTELQQAMASGRVTSAQLVDAYLARIAAYDQAGPALNAMIRLNPRARAVAELLDAERRSGKVRGPLHGIPIVLKDNYDTQDMNTSGGSVALASHRPRADADVVARLRDAGAVILGKTNLHELAAGITSISSLGGQPRNPYDLARCPGGSSGGTGVAVAASFAAIGWGTDTCGSIRIPAAFASLVGLRPTQGLFSVNGIIPLSLTQDTPGPLARTVTDPRSASMPWSGRSRATRPRSRHRRNRPRSSWPPFGPMHCAARGSASSCRTSAPRTPTSPTRSARPRSRCGPSAPMSSR